MKILKFGKNSVAGQQAKMEIQVLEVLEGFLQALFPAGSISGNDFVIGDVSGSAGKSLKVRLNGDKRGSWYDFSTAKGGHIFELLASHYQLSLTSDMVLILAKAQKLLDDVAEISTLPLPSENKINPALHKVAEWDYLHADGGYFWTITRFQSAIGCKEIRPYNKETGEWKFPPDPRPLFNLPGIATSGVVIIVEGEKCAQALIDAGHCATTAMGGAMAPSVKTDWLPLKDKDVLIWPDNDEPGRKYAMSSAVAALASGAKSVAILSLPEGMPDKWDAADALAEGSTFDVEAFLKDGERIPIVLPNTTDLIAAFQNGDPGTEHGIALVLTDNYANQWRYCASWGRWYYWGGQRWIYDQVLAFSYLARQVCHTASTFSDKPGFRAKLASATTSANIERFARADPAHATTVDAWDPDPLLLNTTGGIVDLRTGTLSPHEPSRFLTKITTAAPQGVCPRWLEFLKDITGDDPEFIDYLQRVLGYCLTGLTTEHALFFLYGTGANGKSVFLNVISSILGDYAKTAPMDTFMDTRSDRHPTDLAGLRGARFVCAVETEQGRRWSESKIKSITGGDTISARFMRQDFFEFVPQFKLLIAGNHKPAISNVDEAMSRRIHLVPFTVYIPPEKRDKNLTAKLLTERDGILAWMVEGLMKWREMDGLHPPEIVTKATQEYLDAEDVIGRWLEECCEKNSSAFSSSKSLFRSWKNWAEDCGEYVGSRRKLSEQLMARGFQRDIVGQARGFRGIDVKSLSSLDFSKGEAPSFIDPDLEDQM